MPDYGTPGVSTETAGGFPRRRPRPDQPFGPQPGPQPYNPIQSLGGPGPVGARIPPPPVPRPQPESYGGGNQPLAPQPPAQLPPPPPPDNLGGPTVRPQQPPVGVGNPYPGTIELNDVNPWSGRLPPPPVGGGYPGDARGSFSPPGTTPLTGQETPYSVLPGQDRNQTALLMQLMRSLRGGGDPTAASQPGMRSPWSDLSSFDVSTSTAGAPGGAAGGSFLPPPPAYMQPGAFSAPNVSTGFDSADFQQAQEAAFDKARAELADRGINWSSEAAPAFGRALVPLLLQKAQMAQSASMANASNALRAQEGSADVGLRGQGLDLERSQLANQMEQFRSELANRIAEGNANRRLDTARLGETGRQFDVSTGEGRRRFDTGSLFDLLKYQTGVGAQNREELRGERGYQDQLRTQARDQALQEQGLGESYDRDALDQYLRTLGPGMNSGLDAYDVLRSAAGGGLDLTRTAGDVATQESAGISDIAGLLADLLGARKAPAGPPRRTTAKPSTRLPAPTNV